MILAFPFFPPTANEIIKSTKIKIKKSEKTVMVCDYFDLWEVTEELIINPSRPWVRTFPRNFQSVVILLTG